MRHPALRTPSAFVLGAVFQCPRRAEAQVGVVLGRVQLHASVCDLGAMANAVEPLKWGFVSVTKQ